MAYDWFSGDDAVCASIQEAERAKEDIERVVIALNVLDTDIRKIPCFEAAEKNFSTSCATP